MPIRIAIVGSGISGLAAFWALNKDIYEVHLYECNDYFGGHSHSVQWKDTNVFVDTGFTLFNDTTYRENSTVCRFTSNYGH